MGFIVALTALAALAAGFVAGLVTFRRSQLWCVICGATLRCVECANQSRTEAPYVGAAHTGTRR